MPEFGLDFASGQRLAVRWPGAGRVVLLCGVVALVFSAWDAQRQIKTNNALAATLSRLQAERKTNAPRYLTGEAKAAFTASRTPWGAILSRMESARSQDIALISLKADASRNAIRISGQAKDFAALNRFVSSLSKEFPSVSLVTEKLTETGLPVVVAFEMDVGWQ